MKMLRYVLLGDEDEHTENTEETVSYGPMLIVTLCGYVTGVKYLWVFKRNTSYNRLIILYPLHFRKH